MLPNRPLTNLDILKFGKHLSHFRGVFMRDNLPSKAWNLESGIINLDNSSGPGTHWVAYYKNNKYAHYFDSFGNLKPPLEVVKYLDVNKLMYNYNNQQKFNTYICGHLCLKFLLENAFEKINK